MIISQLEPFFDCTFVWSSTCVAEVPPSTLSESRPVLPYPTGTSDFVLGEEIPTTKQTNEQEVRTWHETNDENR